MNKALIGIDKSESFRVYLAITNGMVGEAMRIHETTPLATAALGRVLTGAGLMGLMLKNVEDKLTVQFKGDGPGGEILATATGTGMVKGYISNPNVDLPLRDNGKLDVGAAIGKGTVTVIKDLGLKEPYVGKVDLVSGEIAEDLTSYFYYSEQLPTSVALGVKVSADHEVAAAGGMIIQMLPNADPNSVDSLESLLKKLSPITTMVEETIKENLSNKEETICKKLLELIFKDMPDEYKVNVLEYRDIQWKCDCSVPRLEQVLLTLGKEELNNIIKEDGKAEVVCQFCRKRYIFDKEDLEMLLRVAIKSEEILERRKKNKEKKKC